MGRLYPDLERIKEVSIKIATKVAEGEEEEEAAEEEEMKEAGSLSAFFTIAADCTTALQKYVTLGDKAYIQL